MNVFIWGIFLGGCASEKAEDTEMEDSSQEPIITYFVGTSTLTSYEGFPMNEESDLAIKKIIDPKGIYLGERSVYGG